MTVLLCVISVAAWSAGGLLSVIISRVPRGIPLRGRRSPCWCAACRARVRLGWVSPAAAVLAALVVERLHAAGRPWLAPAVLAVAAVGLVLSAIDVRWHRLPDALVLPSYPVVLVLLCAGAAVGGSAHDVLRAVLGSTVLFGVFLVLAVLARGGLGFGDVKLAGLLGLVAGAVSWLAVVLSVVLPFLAVSAAAVVVLLGRGGRSGASLPFGPFMVVGTLVAVLAGPAVVSGYVGLVSG